ncbi:major facilitator superfamily domain-containing protein [Lasiosphaeria ovina]|uniref:Major facilitator superfamily domain-containing protein n=1 Tax=Lasiosphaeria ovina TaxID=92902 RepID=A0AAE0KGJ4_9PEZI|nr:major facilitator superfamily domain-containing protein [Lasiosphaeria ovina]
MSRGFTEDEIELIPSAAWSSVRHTDGAVDPESSAQDTTVGGTSEHQPLSGWKLAAVIASVTFVVLLMYLDTSIVSTAVPRITDEFHSLDDIGWYISVYQLASAAFQPLSGKIYTKINIKWAFLAFFAVFEAGSAVCGAARSSAMFISGRAVAGMGAAGLMNGSLTIVANSVPLNRRPSITGLIMGVGQLGIAGGPLIGGALTEYSTWRWCFYLNLPIGLVAAVGLCAVDIPDPVPKLLTRSFLWRIHDELDLVGFALFAPSAAMFLLALQGGGSGTWAWKSATVIGLFYGSGATFVFWLLWNWRKGKEALFPVHLIKERSVWSSAITGSFSLCALFLAAYFLPIYFQAIKGTSPFMSGVSILPSILSQLVFAGMSGIAVERTGFVTPYLGASAVFLLLSNGLFSTLGSKTPVSLWATFQVLNGIGRGIGLQMPALVLQAGNPTHMSMSLGFLIFLQFFSSSIVMAAANIIFYQGLRSKLAVDAPNVNAMQIIAAGATGFRKIVSEADLPGVLAAYSTSLDNVFILGIGVSAVMLFVTMFIPWMDIRH